MAYTIDWSNPAFPAISEAPGGLPWAEVAQQVATHHLVAALDHIKALETLIQYQA